jgi:hypothetical protein|tara:strand:+ start:203 stop:394 length:192 start_codon:yes stop_codon:yes gene_type:complete
MIITKKSILSGEVRSLDLNITQSQIDLWKGGMVIQKAMPKLSVDEREFVMTGIIPEEWFVEVL